MIRYFTLCLIAFAAPAQMITTVANFKTAPSGILQAADGSFYGTDAYGGTGSCASSGQSIGCGIIFKVMPDGTLSTLSNFQPGPDASNSFPLPVSLLQGTDGSFYGETEQGGSGCTVGCGTIFKMTPDGSMTTLYAFDRVHGFDPKGGVVEGTDGNFYGFTLEGGASSNCNPVQNGCGTVFKITPQGSLTTLYSFDLTHGAIPQGLIQGADGNIYGTTAAGGPGNFCPSSDPTFFLKGCGTVFQLTPAGALATLYTFQGAADGLSPSSLIQGMDGDFYGIVSPNGSNPQDFGSIFKVTPAGVFTKVATFLVTMAYPNSLIQASDGTIYGTTQGVGGSLVNGVVIQQPVSGSLFKLSLNGELLDLYDFCKSAPCVGEGTVGGHSLILGSDGNLYGTTDSGGIKGGGILFRYDLLPPNSPAISTSGGVLNGASFQPGISSGSWMTINGTNLSSKTDTWNNSIVKGALPISLDGVSVMVGDQPAYIEYISATQINAVVPDVPTGNVAVTVTNSNGTSQAVMTLLSPEQPAFFQWGSFAVATRQDFSLAVKDGTFPGTTTVPAKPGDVIILWGTGFGPTSPSAPAGVETPSSAIYNTATAVSVTVGGKSTTVYGAALAPGYAGLYQVAIQIPTSLADGDYPVIATINGARSPAATLITVHQ